MKKVKVTTTNSMVGVLVLGDPFHSDPGCSRHGISRWGFDRWGVKDHRRTLGLRRWKRRVLRSQASGKVVHDDPSTSSGNISSPATGTVDPPVHPTSSETEVSRSRQTDGFTLSFCLFYSDVGCGCLGGV